MSKEPKPTVDHTAARKMQAGKISPQALKRARAKKRPLRGSDIPVSAPRGGTGRGMAGR